MMKTWGAVVAKRPQISLSGFAAMDLFRRNPHSRRQAAALAGILAAIVVPGPTSMQGAGQAPQQQELTPQERTPTFKLQVERNLVPVSVIVRDAQGKPVRNLTKEDFRILDDGKPQVITQFSAEGALAAPIPGAARAEAETEPSAGPKIADRFVAFYFDDLVMKFEDIGPARDAAAKYLQTSLQPTDRVAIYTSSGQHNLDFTADRDKLQEALSRLHPMGVFANAGGECPDLSDYEAYMIDERKDRDALALATAKVINCRCGGNAQSCRDPIQMAQFAARRRWTQVQTQTIFSLVGLEKLVRRLSTLPGQRTVIFVSRGFISKSQLQMISEIIDRAVRAGVVVNALDPRGLVAFVPGGNATQPGSGVAPGLWPIVVRMQLAEAQEDTDVLAEVADGTGGVFFHNNNDLDAGFAKVTATPEVYYTLAFSPPNLKYDGRFHSLKVQLVNNSGLSVVARRGYFAPRKLPDAVGKVSEEVEAAAFSLAELKELPVDVQTQYSQSANGQTQLSVHVHLDIHTLRFRRRQDTHANDLTFVTVLFDRDGKYVDGKRSPINLNLRDSELERALASGIDLKATFVVKPGTYLIREVVRDSEDRHLAALNSMVEIPTQEPVRAATPRSKAEVPDLSAYRQADPITSHPIERLRKEIPELKNLQPSTDQSSLPLILSRVGDNLALFLKNFVNTTSLEDIDEYRDERAMMSPLDESAMMSPLVSPLIVGPGPRRVPGGANSINSIHQRFRYLMVARPGARDRLEEYRTSLKGDDRSADRPVAGFLTTIGFASLPLLLDHHGQALSDFRCLGAQEVNGRLTEVVAFAQHPDPAGAVTFLRLLPEESIPLLLQGVAWIDAENYQIVRMRTDLLAPLKSAGLQQETAVVRLHPVTFRRSPAVLWLPQEVEVTIAYLGMRFENRHRYSHYELFTVETEQKVQSPDLDSAAPQR
jgi:VWFA-related protein